jgi:glycosyltransferase involved in cell wall biosynthesis
MKICLLGPAYPFRGGIAHYTTLLCRTLRTNHDVKFISFRRQYPRILFPGQSDKDTSREPLKIDTVDYTLDSINPLTWVKVFQIIKAYKPDKLIIPWWVAFWAPQFWSIVSLVKLNIQTQVVFICHNVVEHESHPLKKMATKAILSKADRIITHSKEDTWRLKDLLGNGVDAITAFHPTYTDLSKKRFTKEQARDKLGLTGNVLLFFGFIRQYKGLDVLLDAMPIVLKEKKLTLLIVGEFWSDKQSYIDKSDRLGISQHIRIVDEYVPNEEIGVYFAASDLIVQPYISASGSGICQIAYGFDRPVIATNVGSLSEVVRDGINGRLVDPGNPRGLALTILESLEPDVLSRFTINANKTKDAFSWEKMANIVLGQRAVLKNIDRWKSVQN